MDRPGPGGSPQHLHHPSGLQAEGPETLNQGGIQGQRHQAGPLPPGQIGQEAEAMVGGAGGGGGCRRGQIARSGPTNRVLRG